jgi:hypothetical protein
METIKAIHIRALPIEDPLFERSWVGELENVGARANSLRRSVDGRLPSRLAGLARARRLETKRRQHTIGDGG